MVTRSDYVEALKTERRYAETLPAEVREQRLADIDAELSRFEPQPQAKARGRGPEVG
jgi:hypothetical protein